MKKLFALWGLLIVAALLPVGSVSQTIRQERFAHFQNIDMNNGLPSNQILDIIQDNSGYIWIATDKGLSRYDGFQIINFKHDASDSLSLPHANVTSLAIDNNNNLYIATHNGIARYNRDTESFTKIPGYNADPLSNPHVRKILLKNNDTLYAATQNGVLNRILIQKNKSDYFYHTPTEQPYYTYHCLYLDANGDLWTGSRMTGLYKLCGQNDKLEAYHLTTSDKSPRQPDVAAFLKDTKGRSWLGSINGFYSLNESKKELTKLFGSSTFTIIEGNSGELWLGTGHGLVNYNVNKKTFTIYNHDPSDPHSLVHNHINQIIKDRDGNIWAATNNGISILPLSTYQPYHLRLIPGESNSLSHNFVTSLLEDKDSSVWIGTMGGGLNHWNLFNNKITIINRNSPQGRNLISDRIKTLYQDKDGYIWVGLWEGRGFNRLNPKSGETKEHRINPNSLQNDWYNSFLQDSKNRFWLGVWGHRGMVSYDREKKTVLPPNLAHLDEPYTQSITHLAFDDENIWMATNRNNIYSFSTSDSTFKIYSPKWKYEPVFPYLPSNNTIEGSYSNISDVLAIATNHKQVAIITNNAFLYSNEKNRLQPLESIIPKKTFTSGFKNHTVTNGEEPGIWYASNSDEIVLIDSRKGIIIPFISNDNAALPIFGKTITSCLRDNNTLWVTTSSSLLKYDLINNQFQEAATYFELSGDESLKKVVKGHNDNLLLFTNTSIAHKDNDNWTWISIRGQFSKGMKANTILSALPGNLSNEIWLGTENGLYQVVVNNDTLFQSIKELSNRQILSLAYGTANDLWVGTDSGPALVNTLTLETRMLNKPANDRLSCHLITFLNEDNRGYIWAGTTNGGVNQINRENLFIRHHINGYPKPDRFWGDNATCFYQSMDGTIWIGGLGLNKYNKDLETFTHYTTHNGFPDNTINTISEDSDGFLWLGFNNAIARFNPESEEITILSSEKLGLPISTVFTSSLFHSTGDLIFGSSNGIIRFNPKEIILKTAYPPPAITSFILHGKRYKSQIEQKETIKLKHDQNFFSIRVSPLVYPSQTFNAYYQLEGVDKNPLTIPINNEIFYTSIPPGKYTFKLISQYSEDALLYIIITPPYWKTWWFTFLVILAVVGLVWFFIRQHTNKLVMQNRALEIEQRLLRTQMNPHFIFNSLSAIQSFIFSNSPLEAGRYLSKFSKLMRLTLQNSREPFIPLKQEIESMQFYLDLQKLRRNNGFNYQLNYDELNPEAIAIPPMLVQPFVENCIEHGFIETKEGGHISISFALKEDYLVIKILDNGIGINASLKRANKDKSHESLASIITRERLNTLNKKGNNFKLTIQDCSETDLNTNGTLVTITAPIKKINESKSTKDE